MNKKKAKGAKLQNRKRFKNPDEGLLAVGYTNTLEIQKAFHDSIVYGTGRFHIDCDLNIKHIPEKN